MPRTCCRNCEEVVHELDEDFSNGAYLILTGLFKKVVIADNIAHVVDTAFKQFPTDMDNFSIAPTGGTALIAIYAFAIQIYCDFSGYTDIARGVARMMGFELIRNFNLPYFSRNPVNSGTAGTFRSAVGCGTTSTSRLAAAAKARFTRICLRNLMLTMLIGGLWHGAAWTFVAWGVSGASCCVPTASSNRGWTRSRQNARAYTSRGMWSASSSRSTWYALAGYYSGRIRSNTAVMLSSVTKSLAISHLDVSLMMTFWFTAGFFVLIQLIQEVSGKAFIAMKLPALRSLVYAAAIVVILVWGDTGGRTFIYFQF